MARRRFFVGEFHHGRAVMTGDEVKHLRQVLRAEVGQRYELSDGSQVFLCEIEDFRKGSITFKILEELPQPKALLDITLCAALIKFDRFELLIEKATELGATRILPFVALRSDKGLDQAAPKRLERWNRIAMEAAKQSHRVLPPPIGEPLTFAGAIDAAQGLKLLLDEEAKLPLLAALPEEAERRVGDAVTVLIGPEGGWTDKERESAQLAGFQAASLGDFILRTETAAASAISVLNAGWLISISDGKQSVQRSTER